MLRKLRANCGQLEDLSALKQTIALLELLPEQYVEKMSKKVCTDQFEARLRLGRLSSSRVAMARVLTFRFLMCISSRCSILLT